MKARAFDPRTDLDAVRRIWEEVGWIERDNNRQAEFLSRVLAAARTQVAELNGTPECVVATCSGDIQHLDDSVSLGAVLAVTTGMAARKRGLASRLAARAVAADAQAGLATSALGMFEQGYYTRLGFGNGPYEHMARFNPAQLLVDEPRRPPHRLGLEDYQQLYQALLRRWGNHGAVRLHAEALVQAEMGWTEEPLGLGYRDEQGELTHFVWGSCKGENGPFRITVLAYRSLEQLLELLGLLKTLSNQILIVELQEPAHIQLQDLLAEPLHSQEISHGSKFAEKVQAEAWWQLRINDLLACLASTHLNVADSLSFNLVLSDPISEFLPADHPWQGIGGDYTVHLGQECQARPGLKPALPTLRASVDGFSRLWIGAAPATAIAATGALQADSGDLLTTLDQTLCLPVPRVGWDF